MGRARGFRVLPIIELVDFLLSIVEVLVVEVEGASGRVRVSGVALLLWLVAVSVVAGRLSA